MTRTARHKLTMADYKARLGHPLAHTSPIDQATGELLPTVTICTGHDGPLGLMSLQLFIEPHPDLRPVRTREQSPGQDGSRERGFRAYNTNVLLTTLRHVVVLSERAADNRVEYNTIRPHEAIAWNRPLQVHRTPKLTLDI